MIVPLCVLILVAALFVFEPWSVNRDSLKSRADESGERLRVLEKSVF